MSCVGCIGKEGKCPWRVERKRRQSIPLCSNPPTEQPNLNRTASKGMLCVFLHPPRTFAFRCTPRRAQPHGARHHIYYNGKPAQVKHGRNEATVCGFGCRTQWPRCSQVTAKRKRVWMVSLRNEDTACGFVCRRRWPRCSQAAPRRKQAKGHHGSKGGTAGAFRLRQPLPPCRPDGTCGC